MLAEMAVDIEALLSFTFRFTQLVDEGGNMVKEAAIVKLYASEVYNCVADKALQVHCGIGSCLNLCKGRPGDGNFN